uniref:Uncharacterized protein n=1 Tax=Pyramimonas obovata TaxID=1411642 RepID=A0A7S0MV65_9CHLO|mmetsp:Transcript_13361/g.28376  ORF Transcript_13361/g.28376 Transcript_13361/m.28376 type:complete len:467 (+) Transcript_13361:112-1512(+)|eukprot:CAMPEP_0118930308 /NCGR_PEP_ID=MMETSP1169-20130426/7041_1 /TAXON_ID=36882 /ORGANISM="Pyramimonas obovata, Strain CCMP722" /LENGTH=466 /DNA_ID=CAMNT_0006872639 /DNA_START=46 /DNA_END=1446 /DNA_ORIENTATION=+
MWAGEHEMEEAASDTVSTVSEGAGEIKEVDKTGSYSARARATTQKISSLWSSVTSVSWSKKKAVEVDARTQGDGAETAEKPPAGDTSAEDNAREAESKAAEATPSSGEADAKTQSQDAKSSEGTATTTGYLGSYLGTMKKYTGQMGAAAYTASKSTATSLYTGAKQTGLLSHGTKRSKPPAHPGGKAGGGGWSLSYFKRRDPHAWDDSIFRATKALTGKTQTNATGAGLLLASMEDQWREIDRATHVNQEKHMEAFHAMRNVVVRWQRNRPMYEETETRLRSLPGITDEIGRIKGHVDQMMDTAAGLNAVLEQAERNAHAHQLVLNKQKADRIYRDRESKHRERMAKWEQQKAKWEEDTAKQRKNWRAEEEVVAVQALEAELAKEDTKGAEAKTVTEVALGLTGKDNKLVDSKELEAFYSDASLQDKKSARARFEERKEERRRRMLGMGIGGDGAPTAAAPDKPPQ